MIDNYIEKAFDLLDFSYCPYSKFRVGCLIVTKDNRIYNTKQLLDLLVFLLWGPDPVVNWMVLAHTGCASPGCHGGCVLHIWPVWGPLRGTAGTLTVSWRTR